MAEMTAEVLKAIEKTMPYCIATASPDGKTNLIYVTYLKALDAKTIVVADNKFEKTRVNLDSNPYASVVVLDSDTKKAYQLKGSLKCYTEGKEYEDTVSWVHVNHPQMTPKAAFIMNVEEVYNGAERLA